MRHLKFECPECGRRHQRKGRCKQCVDRSRHEMARREEPYRVATEMDGRVAPVLFGSDWTPGTAE